MMAVMQKDGAAWDGQIKDRSWPWNWSKKMDTETLAKDIGYDRGTILPMPLDDPVLWKRPWL